VQAHETFPALQLPDELLALVLRKATAGADKRTALALRLVCKRFDAAFRSHATHASIHCAPLTYCAAVQCVTLAASCKELPWAAEQDVLLQPRARRDSLLGKAEMHKVVRLRCLRRLVLSGCLQISDWSLVHIAPLTALQMPQVAACALITDAGLAASAGKLRRLRRINVSGVRVTDAGVLPVAALPRLEHLAVAGCGVTDAALTALQQSPLLETLDVSGCNVTDAGVCGLSRCAALRLLSVTLGERVTGGAIARWAGVYALPAEQRGRISQP